jgi:acyl carrier protein
MNTNESVETTILNVLVEVLNTSTDELRANTVLAAYEWDSLASLEALAQVESRLGVTLDLRLYHGELRVGDLVSLVEDALAAKAVTARR